MEGSQCTPVNNLLTTKQLLYIAWLATNMQEQLKKKSHFHSNNTQHM